jgi:phosphoenolpyruvate phosphomutase
MTGDLFHRGHLELIKKAKALGDYLMVGLHPDDIVKKYKRASIISYEDRKAIIESIKEVDEVVEDCMDYRSPTMFGNILKYKPTLLVHGNDWLPPLYKKMNELTGIKIEQVPYYPYTSTTDILKGIKSKNCLKEALKKKEKLVVVSANDAITAKLVEEFEFDGIWVSSFESSANLGLVDNETINLSDMINIVRPIVNSTSLPIIVDIDTGYGDIEQTIRATRELEKLGVSAICIEDNIFPKSNSLWGGTKSLYDITKFGNKIKAIKESTNNLLVIARTEALIRNKGRIEALTRAEHYVKCGADMILMHSRDRTGKEALEITKYWEKDIPLVIIPSKFPQITNSELFNVGYNIVIFANQTMRAKIFGIKQALKVLKTEQNAKALDDYICSLNDFRNLTPIEETKKRKERYE